MKEKTKGIMCILVSAFFFALMSLFVKMAGDLPVIQKGFFRNLIALFTASLAIYKNRKTINFKLVPAAKIRLFCRAFFGTIGFYANFYAVDHLVLSDANMLSKLSPFFGIIISYFLLKETISKVQMGIVGVAFCGILLILKPGGNAVEPFAVFMGVIAGAGAGAAYAFVRSLKPYNVAGPIIIFAFSSFSCLIALPFIIFDYAPMSFEQFALLMAAGVCAAVAQFAVTAAYTHAPAKELAVYDYTQVIFAAIFSFIAFGVMPDILSILGYVIIIGMGICMFIYNNRKEA